MSSSDFRVPNVNMPVMHHAKSAARQFREALVEECRKFENAIDLKTEEVWCSIFVSTREIYCRPYQIGSDDSGLIILRGEIDDGKVLDLSMHYSLFCWQLHAVKSEEPRRVGF